MKISKTGTALAVALAIAVVPAAMAGQGKHKGDKGKDKQASKQGQKHDRGAMLDQHFSQLDTNRDGAITRNEWTRDAQKFDRMDTNRDGALTRSEIEQAMQSHRGGRGGDLRGQDLNGDGVIARTEWRGDLTAFDRLDTNRDGILTGDEVRNSRNQRGNTAGKRFKGMDSNGDGLITRSEWRGNDQSFEQHDLNRDGVLSGDELRGRGRRK